MESPHAGHHTPEPVERPIPVGYNGEKILDIDSLNGPEVPETQTPILEQPTGSEWDSDRASREARNKKAMKV